MRKLFFPILIAALSAIIPNVYAIGVCSAAAYQLVGVDFQNSLYDVNQATGATSNPRHTGIAHMTGIAAQPGTGQLFTLTTFDSTQSTITESLLKLNFSTGAATVVGSTGLRIFEGDLAFQPSTGVLFGIEYVPTDQNDQHNYIFTMNINNGVPTLVGRVGTVLTDYSSLAFNANGTLYAIDNVLNKLLVLNPANGAIISSVPLGVQLGGANGMAFDPITGVAFVADGETNGTNKLYSLNTTTGALTVIGPLTGTLSGLSGLAFVPVPEPSSILLLGLSGIGLAMFRRLAGTRRRG